MAIQVQLRRDTAANWTSVNPTLAQGEIGIETDTLSLKIGDGLTDWNTLPYYSTGESTIYNSGFNYQTDAIVGLGGKIYISLQDNNLGNDPATEPTWWEEFSGGGGGGGFTKQTLTDAASISWNVANGNYATETIEGSRTQSNPSNLTVGQELILDITQGTGGSHTITWDTYFTFGGGIEPILSSAEGDTDSLRFLVVSATEIRFTNANFDV